ncbi:MAG: antitoxin Xre-like helix-turn-helix domain-containing protein [Alphaproteobacteria bacterium]
MAPPDLGDEAVRRRLSAPSFRAFLATADYLGIGVAERCTLLGGLPPSTYHRWAAKGSADLPRDLLERISLVLGIVKGLRLLFAADEAGKSWLRAANADAPFAGASPLQRMLRGSIADLYAVRRYIDAWRGAWP